MRPDSLQNSPRTITIAAVADLADADAIKTAIATSVAAQSYSGAALNGVRANPGPALPQPGGHTDVSQYPTVTTAAHAGSYNVADAIVFAGKFGGRDVERSALLTQVNGNETIVADGPVDEVTEVRLPAQNDALGSFTFGFTDIGPIGRARGELVVEEPWRRVVCNGSGNLHVLYAGGYPDTIPMIVGQPLPAEPIRIYADSTATFTAFQ